MIQTHMYEDEYDEDLKNMKILKMVVYHHQFNEVQDPKEEEQQDHATVTSYKEK